VLSNALYACAPCARCGLRGRGRAVFVDVKQRGLVIDLEDLAWQTGIMRGFLAAKTYAGSTFAIWDA